MDVLLSNGISLIDVEFYYAGRWLLANQNAWILSNYPNDIYRLFDYIVSVLANKMSSAMPKRYHCFHCNEDLHYRVFCRHKEDFYNPLTNEWQLQRNDDEDSNDSVVKYKQASII